MDVMAKQAKSKIRQGGPLSTCGIRAKWGRTIRRVARSMGRNPRGPIGTRRGVPAAARMVDAEKLLPAPPSHPVLPRPHPLLSASPLRFPATWAKEFRYLQIYGPSVTAVDSQELLLADVSIEWGRKAEDNWTFRRWRTPIPQFLPGRTLVLASTGGDTYFHWVTDVLPRIRICVEAGYRLDSFDHVLVNGTESGFQQTSLRHLGVSPRQWVPLGKRETAFLLEEAVLPSLPGVPGVVPPATVDFLVRSFSGAVSTTDKKLFLGRGGAQHRSLRHEGEIWARLEAMEFQAVECGALSMPEQADLFRSAEMIVAAHGAALTNLAFCRPGTRVVELMSPKYVNPCYRDLCVAAGLRHAAVIGDGGDWLLSTKHDQPSAPITASWALIDRALESLPR